MRRLLLVAMATASWALSAPRGPPPGVAAGGGGGPPPGVGGAGGPPPKAQRDETNPAIDLAVNALFGLLYALDDTGARDSSKNLRVLWTRAALAGRGLVRGSKRVRNSQLQRLTSRSFFTRFG